MRVMTVLYQSKACVASGEWFSRHAGSRCRPRGQPETGASYSLVGDAEDPTRKVEGLTLSNFNVSAKEVPLSPAYLAGLRKLVPLPTEVTFEQPKPQLAAAGIPISLLVVGLLALLLAGGARMRGSRLMMRLPSGAPSRPQHA
jgi:hypothetical protein